MSGPIHCTDMVDTCEDCPRYMDDCDGDPEKIYDKWRSDLTTSEIEDILSEHWTDRIA